MRANITTDVRRPRFRIGPKLPPLSPAIPRDEVESAGFLRRFISVNVGAFMDMARILNPMLVVRFVLSVMLSVILPLIPALGGVVLAYNIAGGGRMGVPSLVVGCVGFLITTVWLVALFFRAMDATIGRYRE